MQRVLNAWSNNPYKIIIIDFEYDSKLLPVMKHEAIFQIVIANACGPINYERNSNEAGVAKSVSPACLSGVSKIAIWSFGRVSPGTIANRRSDVIARAFPL